MKNTISFFSFKLSSRQVLSRDAFNRKLENDENSYGNNERLEISATIGSAPSRIPPEEMERLNKHIAEMNKNGWSITSIQSIETGIYDYDYKTDYNETLNHSWAYGWGWGYGSSFTEGVIIYWEKE